jgi:hypothetical protein
MVASKWFVPLYEASFFKYRSSSYLTEFFWKTVGLPLEQFQP